MRWFVFIGIACIILVVLTMGTGKNTDVNKMMAKVRAAKAKKAAERKINTSKNADKPRGRQGGNQTQAGPIMKVA